MKAIIFADEISLHLYPTSLTVSKRPLTVYGKQLFYLILEIFAISSFLDVFLIRHNKARVYFHNIQEKTQIYFVNVKLIIIEILYIMREKIILDVKSKSYGESKNYIYLKKTILIFFNFNKQERNQFGVNSLDYPKKTFKKYSSIKNRIFKE